MKRFRVGMSAATAAFSIVCAAMPAFGDDSASIADHSFSGTTVRVKLANGNIDQIDFDEYLKGVVQKEIGWYINTATLTNAEKTEGFKTQAVAAATYYEEERVAGQNFDILGTTSNQAYEAYDAATYPLIGTAVDALYTVNGANYDGKRVEYDDGGISAVFFGHNSGVNLASEDHEDFGFYNVYLRDRFTADIDTAGAADGHGVGMSQAGIKHFVDDGKTYDKILKYYYQPQPCHVRKVVMIQDTDGDKSFDDETAVYTAEWVLDEEDEDNLTREKDLSRLEDDEDERVTIKGYTTKIIVTFSEEIADGQAASHTLYVGDPNNGGTRVTMYRLQSSRWGQQLSEYGTFQSGTGLADADAMERVKFRVSVGILTVEKMRQDQINGMKTLYIKAHHLKHTDWQLDTNPATRAWKNIDEVMQRYDGNGGNGGTDTQHSMTFDPNPANARNP